MKSAEPQKTIFLDRDGTLIEEVNFLSRVEDLRLFPFTLEAVNLLKNDGFRLVIITNQSGIDRGIFDEQAMHAIHEKLQEKVGGAIDGFYFCPHLPGAGCECRKPNLGMINSAMNNFGIDMSRSWIIGDKKIDVETGFNAGIGTAMVRTGYGRVHSALLDREPDIIAENLLSAAELIVAKRS